MKTGFTFTELIVVIGILAGLFAFTINNLARPQLSASLNSSASQLLADLKSQQLKAMSGDSEDAGAVLPHSIYIENTSYVLFRGSIYVPSDSSNFTVSLDPALSLSTSFSGSVIVFLAGSGEISGFTPGSNTLTLTHGQSSDSNIIQLNRYGVVSSY